MTTQGLKRGLEADAWLASMIQNLHALSDEELLEAGCLISDDATGDANNTNVIAADATNGISDAVVERYLQHDVFTQVDEVPVDGALSDATPSDATPSDGGLEPALRPLPKKLAPEK